MEKNVGRNDKIARLIIAAIFAYFGYTISMWFYIGTGYFLLTAVFGICLFYRLFHIDTTKKRIRKSRQ